MGGWGERGRGLRRQLGLISFGYLLLLLGVLWMLNPSLPADLVRFFRDFRLERIDGEILFPVPGQPQSHTSLFTTAMQFCLAYGGFQIFIFILRFIQDEPINMKAGTASATAFWLMMGFFLHLLVNEAIKWLGLLAGFIISVGLAITVSNMMKLLAMYRGETKI
ncbi:MAG: hypothetical protein QXD04_05980 [Candidatus Bathyarchaeia archaeon]|nr:hypothetical protein [Candidatus Bathyarchaeota archaeon]